MKQRTTFSILIGVIFLLGGVMMNFSLAKLRKAPERRTAPEKQTLVEVLDLEPSHDTVRIKGFGSLAPRIETNIAAEVGGTLVIRNPHVEAGAQVEQGEELFRIDPENYRLIQEKAQAAIQQTKAQLVQLEADIKGQRENLGVSQTALDLAKRELERFESLVAKKATSQSVVDQKRNALQAALGAHVRNKNALTQAQTRRGTLEATLRLQTAALAEADLNLTRTSVRAPFAGIIAGRQVEQGEFLRAGQVLATMYDPNSLEVRVPVALTDLPWLVPLDAEAASLSTSLSGGAFPYDIEAEISPLAESKNAEPVVWRGKVVRAGALIDPKTRTLELVVKPLMDAASAAQVRLLFLKGLFVQVDLIGRPNGLMFKVPRASISHRNTVSLFAEGKLARKDVVVRRIMGDTAFIAGDVQPGDRLILTPLPEGVVGMDLVLASAASAL